MPEDMKTTRKAGNGNRLAFRGCLLLMSAALSLGATDMEHKAKVVATVRTAFAGVAGVGEGLVRQDKLG